MTRDQISLARGWLHYSGTELAFCSSSTVLGHSMGMSCGCVLTWVLSE